jgi:hypothetical protein
MPVEYPQVILAIKTWIGQHKVTPSSSMEVDGQPAIKKAGFGDMLSMALGEIISFAAEAGLNFAVGDAAGLDKLVNNLPEGFREPLKSVVGSIGEMKNSALNSIGIPSDAFTNPLADTISSFKSGLTLGTENLNAIRANLDLSTGGTGFSDFVNNAAESMGGYMKTAMDSMKSWTDTLSLGTGDNPFRLTDAFSAVNSSSTKALELIGITKAPTLSELCGTLVNDEITKNFQTAFTKELSARLEMQSLLPAAPGEGAPPPELSYEAKAAFEKWKTAFGELEVAAVAIQTQVDSDQANVAALSKQDAAMDALMTASSTYANLEDPAQKALYESTLGAKVKGAAIALAPLTVVSAGSFTDPNVPNT